MVNPDEVKARLESGEYVTRRATMKRDTWGGGATEHSIQEGVFGICMKCRRIEAGKPIKGGSAAQADAQHRRIMERAEWTRLQRSDLTREQAVSAAIEDEFDPHNEPNPGLRAYLLEQATKDEESDEVARQVLAKLDELGDMPRD